MVSTTPDVLATQAATPPAATTTNGTTKKDQGGGIAGRVGTLLHSKSKKEPSSASQTDSQNKPANSSQQSDGMEVPLYKRYASSAVKIIRSRSRSRKDINKEGSSTTSGGDVPPVPLPKDTPVEDAAAVAAKEDKPAEEPVVAPVEKTKEPEAKPTAEATPTAVEPSTHTPAPSQAAKLVRRLSSAGQALAQKVASGSTKSRSGTTDDTQVASGSEDPKTATQEVANFPPVDDTTTATTTTNATSPSTSNSPPSPPTASTHNPLPPVSKGSLLARQVSAKASQVSAKAEDLFPLPRRKTSTTSSSSSIKGKEKERVENGKEDETNKMGAVEGAGTSQAPPAGAIVAAVSAEGTSTSSTKGTNPEWVLVKDKEDPDVDKPLPHPPTLTRRISEKVGEMLKVNPRDAAAAIGSGATLKEGGVKEGTAAKASATSGSAAVGKGGGVEDTTATTTTNTTTTTTKPNLTSRISSKVGAFMKADIKGPLSSPSSKSKELNSEHEPVLDVSKAGGEREVDPANVPLPPDEEQEPSVVPPASTNSGGATTAPPSSFAPSASNTIKTQKLGRRLSARVGDLFKGGLKVGSKGKAKGPEVPPKDEEMKKDEEAKEGVGAVKTKEGKEVKKEVKEEEEAKKEDAAVPAKTEEDSNEEEKSKADIVIPPVDGPTTTLEEAPPTPIPAVDQPILSSDTASPSVDSAPIHVPEQPKSQSPPLDVLVDEVTPPDAALAGALAASGSGGGVPLVIPPVAAAAEDAAKVEEKDGSAAAAPVVANEVPAPVAEKDDVAPAPIDKDAPVSQEKEDTPEEAPKAQSPPLNTLVDEVTPPDAALADALKTSGVASPDAAASSSASPEVAPRPAAAPTQTSAAPSSFVKTSTKAKKLGRRLSAKVGDLFKRDNKAAAAAASGGDAATAAGSGSDKANVGATVGGALVPDAVPPPAPAKDEKDVKVDDEKSKVDEVAPIKDDEKEGSKVDVDGGKPAGDETPLKDGEPKASESTEAIENVEQLPPIPAPAPDAPSEVVKDQEAVKEDKGKAKEVVEATSSSLSSPTIPAATNAAAEGTSTTTAEKDLPEKPLPTKPSKSSRALLNVGRQMSIRASELLKPKPRLDGAASEGGESPSRMKGSRKGKAQEEQAKGEGVKQDKGKGKAKEVEVKAETEKGWEEVKHEEAVPSPIVNGDTSELKDAPLVSNDAPAVPAPQAKEPTTAPVSSPTSDATVAPSHPPVSNPAPSSFARVRKTSDLGKRLSKSMTDVFKFEGLKGRIGGSGFGTAKRKEEGVVEEKKDDPRAEKVESEVPKMEEEKEEVKEEDKAPEKDGTLANEGEISPVVPPKDEKAVPKTLVEEEQLKIEHAKEPLEGKPVVASANHYVELPAEVEKSPSAGEAPVASDAVAAPQNPEPVKADGETKADVQEQQGEKKRKTKLSLSFKAPKFGFGKKKEKTEVVEDQKEAKDDIGPAVPEKDEPAKAVEEPTASASDALADVAPVTPEKDELAKAAEAIVPPPTAEKETDVSRKVPAEDLVQDEQEEDVKEEEPEILAASRAVSAKAMEVQTPVSPVTKVLGKADGEDVAVAQALAISTNGLEKDDVTSKAPVAAAADEQTKLAS